jgi:hypothetical protein
MKVFISWSGERSQQIGNALREWIQLVLHYVEPWLSHADIDAGQRWADQVAKELENSHVRMLIPHGCYSKRGLSLSLCKVAA